MQQTATIFALSSGRLPAAIAVVRISGPRAREALQSLTGRVPEPRRAALARVRDPQTGEVLDEALALFFPGPNSETGEDTAELQLHGGRAVVAGVLDALSRLEGFRPAEAGEFTRRAFENGRLDLTQVEGLSDLIYADTAAQRRQAFRHLKGLLGQRAETWRGRLIEALALVEAGIDFSDEGDVPGDLIRPALKIARELHDEISAALAGAARGERLREGLVVAIAGPPNAGKSTLLNRIARREAAIVSPYAGTTRDVIEVHLDLEGYPVTLLDTAGIRDSDDPVEQEGVRRARARAAEADLVLWVVDAAGSPDGAGARLGGGGYLAAQAEELARSEFSGGSGSGGGGGSARLNADGSSSAAFLPNRSSLAEADRPPLPDAGRSPFPETDRPPLPFANRSPSPDRVAPNGVRTWLVRNKADLQENDPHNNQHSVQHPCGDEHEFTFTCSALRGDGIDALICGLVHYAKNYFGSGEPAMVTRGRHRSILVKTKAALARALEKEISDHEDVLAEELRMAARGLGRLTGRVDVEDVLDVIFRDFCIGK
jgi:tRNA modification GTPase